MQERRSFSRVWFEVNALLQGEGVTLKGEVKNLSLHGAFMATEAPLPVGTGVELTIYLSGAPEPAVINVTGSVVRVEQGGVGCIFEKMDAQSFAHLRNIIAHQGGSDEQVLTEFAAYARNRGSSEQ